MKVLILSHEHALLPYGWRLKREGHDVAALVVKDRYREAWKGRLDPFQLPKDQSLKDAEQEVRGMIEREGWLVLTDSPRWQRTLSGLPTVFGMVRSESPPPGMILGAWFDGERFRGPHLGFIEWGLWPGGLGPALPGALTLARIREDFPLVEHLAGLQDEIKATGERGLVQVGMQINQEGEWEVSGWQLGWHFLHAHAFVSDQTNLGDVLMGKDPTFPSRFIMVMPVSIPPWPIRCNVPPEQVEVPLGDEQFDLTREDLRSIFFHDIVIDGEGIRTAKTDGLVAVVRGSGNHFELARARALGLAQKLRLPQKQFRGDAGAHVPAALAQLEALGLLV